MPEHCQSTQSVRNLGLPTPGYSQNFDPNYFRLLPALQSLLSGDFFIVKGDSGKSHIRIDSVTMSSCRRDQSLSRREKLVVPLLWSILSVPQLE